MSDHESSEIANQNLRHAFVAMLFAFAISRVGESTIIVIKRAVEFSLLDSLVLSSAFHIFLSIIVITTSWIGWSRSALKCPDRLNTPFDKTYLLLLVDIFLVINYYSLALLIDAEGSINKLSSIEELIGVVVLFSLYLIWELIRIIPLSINNLVKNYAHCKPAIACLMLTSVLFVFSDAAVKTQLISVVGMDICLISIVMHFRVLKYKISNPNEVLTLRHNIYTVGYFVGLLISAIGWSMAHK